jgi:hypothetical protein
MDSVLMDTNINQIFSAVFGALVGLTIATTLIFNYLLK